jgi:hypothetical protein
LRQVQKAVGLNQVINGYVRQGLVGEHRVPLRGERGLPLIGPPTRPGVTIFSENPLRSE